MVQQTLEAPPWDWYGMVGGRKKERSLTLPSHPPRRDTPPQLPKEGSGVAPIGFAQTSITAMTTLSIGSLHVYSSYLISISLVLLTEIWLEWKEDGQVHKWMYE